MLKSTIALTATLIAAFEHTVRPSCHIGLNTSSHYYSTHVYPLCALLTMFLMSKSSIKFIVF